jgi:hypothetical protein
MMILFMNQMDYLLRKIQHEIHLQHDSPLPNVGMYMMSFAKMTDIKKQVEGLLDQGVSRPSSSPCGYLIVMVPKKDGTWRMCVNYRALNKIMMKNRYPLPRIDDSLDQLRMLSISLSWICAVDIIKS